MGSAPAELPGEELHMPSVDDPLAVLRTLGEPSSLWQYIPNSPRRLKVNAHVHIPPNFSAFDSVRQAVALAAAQGVRVLGVSNYYDYGIYGSFAGIARSLAVFPLFGLEVICLLDDLVLAGVKINDPGNPGKMYLCGKGITRFSPMPVVAADLLSTIRLGDAARIAAVIERLAALFVAGGQETGVTEDSVKSSVVRKYGFPLESVYLQERHVAQAFQEALFARVSPGSRAGILRSVFGAEPGPAPDDAVAVQNAIRSHLMKAGKPGYVEERFVGFDHAYRLILTLGGIPCYPVLADGATPICPFEDPVDRLVQSLVARRIHLAELIPNRNAPETVALYARSLRSSGIAVVAGTEHNTPDMLPMEPHCAGGTPVPDPAAAIFWEGACVVAAHQYLMANGCGGYVDDSGDLNPDYSTGEARIRAFAQLGVAVIEKYGRLSAVNV
jgi:hypothetical protein